MHKVETHSYSKKGKKERKKKERKKEKRKKENHWFVFSVAASYFTNTPWQGMEVQIINNTQAR